MANLSEAIKNTQAKSTELKNRILSDQAVKKATPIDVTKLVPTIDTTVKLKQKAAPSASKSALAGYFSAAPTISPYKNVDFTKTVEYRNYLENTQPELFRPAENAQEAVKQLSFWDKAKNVIANPFMQGAIKGLTAITEGAKAVAVTALSAPESLVFSGIQKATGNKESYGDLLKQNMQSNREVAKSYLKGESEIYQIAKVYDPEIDSKTGKSLTVGIVDAFLSPSNMLVNAVSFGVGKGIKIFDTAGNAITLDSKGTKLFKEALNSKISKLADQTDTVALREVETQLAKEWEAMGTLQKYIDKGGIRIGQDAIKGTEAIAQYINKASAVNVMNRIPGFQKAADLLGKAFTPIAQREIKNPAVREIVEVAKRRVAEAKSTAGKTIQDLTKGLNTEDAEKILLYRGTDVLKTMSQASQETAQKIYNYMDELVGRESQFGYTVVENYMPRTYKETPDEIVEKLIDARNRIKQIQKSGGELTDVQKSLLELTVSSKNLKEMKKQPQFVYDRFFQTLEQIDEVGLTLNKDLKKVLENRVRSSIDAVEKMNLVGELERFHFQDMAKEALRDRINGLGIRGNEPEKGFIRKTITDATGKPISVDIPEDTYKMVDDIVKTYDKSGSLKIPEYLKKPLEIYDQGLRFWKQLVLSLPATATRNFLDSTFRNIQDIGFWNTVKPGGFMDAGILANITRPEVLERYGNRIVNYGGREYTLKELDGIMKKMGIYQDRLYEGPIQRSMAKANELSERYVRSQNFLMNLDKTGSVIDSARKTLKTHYDYTNLTGFERGVLSRLFPFYSFRKTNFGFQIDSILHNPAPYVALERVRNAAYRATGGVPEGEPDYIRQGYAIPIGKDEEGNRKYLAGMGLSFEDVDRVFNMVTSKRGFEKEFMGSLSPLPKVTSEVLLKKNFFTGKGYEDVGGSDAKTQSDALKVMNFFAPNFVNYMESTTTSADGTVKQKKTANPYAISLTNLSPLTRYTYVSSMLDRTDKTKGEVATAIFSPAKIYSVNKDYAQTEEYYKKLDIKNKNIKKYMEMGLIKASQSGTYYVVKSFSTGDPVKDADLKQKAKEAIATVQYPK